MMNKEEERETAMRNRSEPEEEGEDRKLNVEIVCNAKISFWR